MTHRIWLTDCPTCHPWTRVVTNPATGHPYTQAMHEDHCTVFPRIQRIDGKRIDE